MNKKYYADVDLYFDDMKYGMTAEVGDKREVIVNMIKDFAKKRKLECNMQSKKLFDFSGKEVGTFKIASKEF